MARAISTEFSDPAKIRRARDDANRKRRENMLLAAQTGGRTAIYQPMEQIIRPFQDVMSFSEVREPRVPPLDLPEAFIEWGKSSEFSTDTFRSDAGSVGFNTKDDDEEPERVRYSFSEEGRTFRDIRVENPQDPDQYIILRQATSIAFGGPEGAQFTLHLSPTAPGTETGSGQTPPAPPDLNEIE